MDNTEQRIISFCTGGRMLDMGIERVIPNLRTVAAVEVEAFAAFNLAAAVEKGVVAPFPVWSDIKTFPSAAFYGKIHGITGGYPCQPFSHAGKRKGKEDPRHLWPHFERHIGAIRPLWGFFENVEGHLSLGFDEVQDSLQRLGYTVEAGIYSAAEMGATQVRERLFILAATDIRELWHSVADHQGFGNRPISELVGWGASTELEQGGKEVGNANNNGQYRTSEKQGEDRSHENQTGCGMYQPAGTNLLSGYECQQKTTNAQNLADHHCNGLRLQQNAKQQQPPLLVGANDEALVNANGKRAVQPKRNRQKIPKLSFDGIKWPAPPGAPQHEWEVPRVVKPGMGCTVDGYNFRADILRMLGNGVVEPVAAHAFYDLLLKQAKNFKLI